MRFLNFSDIHASVLHCINHKTEMTKKNKDKIYRYWVQAIFYTGILGWVFSEVLWTFFLFSGSSNTHD